MRLIKTMKKAEHEREAQVICPLFHRHAQVGWSLYATRFGISSPEAKAADRLVRHGRRLLGDLSNKWATEADWAREEEWSDIYYGKVANAFIEASPLAPWPEFQARGRGCRVPGAFSGEAEQAGAVAALDCVIEYLEGLHVRLSAIFGRHDAASEAAALAADAAEALRGMSVAADVRLAA